MPCNYSLYPKNWKQIRQQILEREGHRCKFCGVKNYDVGYRDKNEYWHPIEQSHQGNLDAEDTRAAGFKIIKIVLTVAHLNHDINENGPENLAALCQLHHLRHDIHYHKKNSRETIKNKKGLQNLF